MPKKPRDLAAHRCLNVRLAGGIYRWEFHDREEDRDLSMEVQGPLLSNDGDLMLAAIRAGAGVGCSFEAIVAEELHDGRLIALLEPWWPDFPGFHLYYSSRVHMPRKLRVFIDFMQAKHTKAMTGCNIFTS